MKELLSVRVRGRIGVIENDSDPKLNGKYVFTVALGAIGEPPDVERTYGFFDTEAQAKIELEAITARISQDAQDRIREVTGEPAQAVNLH